MTGTFQYFREKKSWNKVILYTMTNHLFSKKKEYKNFSKIKQNP